MHRHLLLVGIFVAGEDRERRRQIAVGQRNSSVGGHRDCRGHAGHHLEGNTGSRQRFGFFSAPTEHERIAALQADDVQPAPRAVEKQLGDHRLLDALAAAVFADQDAFRRCRRIVEQPRAGEIVVNHHVGALEPADAVERDEAWRARPGADQIDGPETARRAAVGRVHPG
jgi:hypothetical protein